MKNLLPSPVKSIFLIVSGTLLCFGNLQAQTVQVFSSSGTFTVPQCVTTITVECWGAGGGGGGASEADGGAAGAGGGGGGYAKAVLTNVSGTFTVTVGTGGNGGIGSGSTVTAATAGGSSIVTNGTITVTAQGGGAGAGSTGGVATGVGIGGGGTFGGGVSGTTYKGGNGAEGNNQDDNTGGAGGGGAGNAGSGATPAATGDDGDGTGGAGGPGNPNTAQYAGGAGGSVTGAYFENGGPGTTIGGGGAGGGGETSGGIFGHGTSPGNGGKGGDGQVIITYSTASPTIASITGTGCIGSTITINGTLLSGATSVSIGSSAVSILTNTSTKITGTIAAGTVTGTVTVVTPCGTVSSSSPFTVHPVSRVTLAPQSTCSGSYVFSGHTYTTSGTYSDTTSSLVTGCDSITTITLTIGTSVNRSITDTVCAGSSYSFGGRTLTASGTYLDTATSAISGCDSITTLNLTIGAGLIQFVDRTICGDQSYSFGGHQYNTPGLYSDTTTSSVSGCDSITVLRLAVVVLPTSVTNAYLCPRGIYNFNGTPYTAAGVYNDTLMAAGSNGCDSIATLNLVAANIQGEFVTATATPANLCQGDSSGICASAGFAAYRWSSGDTASCFYAITANTYYVTATDTFGCTVTNYVTLDTATLQHPVITQHGDTLSCSPASSYQWYLNNSALTGDTGYFITATQNGVYTVHITDTSGCPEKTTALDYTTAVNNLQADLIAKVYPNPLTTGNFMVDVNSTLIGAYYEVFDLVGRSIYKNQIPAPHFELISPEAKGTYLLQIANGSQVWSLKLVKLD